MFILLICSFLIKQRTNKQLAYQQWYPYHTLRNQALAETNSMFSNTYKLSGSFGITELDKFNFTPRYTVISSCLHVSFPGA
jgi:hypothetical protein